MIGRRLLHYQIIEKLGEGGMGVVYKGRDTHLNRFVAIKVLPPERVGDPSRKARFVQEARAASALNHPNIIHIYDISSEGGIDFMVMEYVNGKTLDQLIRGRGTNLDESLKVAIQVAGALARAHAAGIVHRDLKPSNIMVDEHGAAKVLDFGLAKLTGRGDGSVDETTATIGVKTAEGSVVGTAPYMSPEQAQGKDLDARSDIFSFGALLYEMASGRRAFARDSAAATIAAVLRDEPPPLSEGAASIPRDLEKIIARCLRKDPARRFQGMADVQVALEEVREESESGVLPATLPPVRRRRAFLWAGSVFLVALAAGAAAWFLNRPAQLAPAIVSALAARAGIEWGPALSPDGKQVAFVWNGEQADNQDIYIQLVDEATPRRLTADPRFDYSPTWSPDALRIAFLRRSSARTEVIIIPSGGGSERKLHTSSAACDFGIQEMARQFCGISWSPDGRFISFVDRESQEAPNSIFFIDVETLQKHKVTTPPDGWFGDGLSVFSPDGLSLAFVRTPAPVPSEIYTLPLSKSGEPLRPPRRITPVDDSAIFGFDWTRDGREVVFASARRGVPALWRVNASGGEPRRLMVGGDTSHWPSLARSLDRLAYTSVTDDWNIWRVAAPGKGPADSPVSPVRITQSPLWDMGPVLSPDDSKVLYNSFYSGSMQVWVCGIDGSGPRRLTDLKRHALSPEWSPDGRRIAVVALAGTDTKLYVIAAEGGAPRLLPTAAGMSVSRPSWSRDGTQIYFVSQRGSDTSLWRVPVQGGNPVLFAPRAGGPIDHSADGRYIYYGGPGRQVWKMPTGGGEPVPVLKLGARALWRVSATGIHVLDPDAEGGPAVRFFPLSDTSTGEFARVPDRKTVKLPGDPDSYFSGTTGAIAVSSDGRWIFYERHDRKDGDILLVENFR